MAEWVLRQIDSLGSGISFESYMARCLYDEEHGYYSAGKVGLGARGDFSTTATLSSLLAKAIIDLWRQESFAYGRMLPLVEIGAGDGALAVAVRSLLTWKERLFARYYIVEKAQSLRKRQQQRLGRFAQHADSVIEILMRVKGVAFMFSNELVDAFPARIFEKTEAGWSELGVRSYARRLVEELHPVSEMLLPDSTIFQQEYNVGQRVEVHQSYQFWMQEWAPHWHKGLFITIDYGALAEGLYYRQPWGTLRGYKNHQRLTGASLYAQSGQCDLTCDVNFSDLILWGEDYDWITHAYMSQKEFLERYVSQKTISRQDEFLCDPLGAGTAFRVLQQRKVVGD